MTEQDIVSQVRELVGNPSKEETADTRLLRHIVASFEWFSHLMKHNLVTDTDVIQLVSGQKEYFLPPDLMRLILVEHNTLRLVAKTTYQWDREGSDWRNAQPSGTLLEYSVQGRNLIFFPPPSSAAITAAPAPVIRYFASPVPNGVLPKGGIPTLGDSDYWLVIYKASIRYLMSHPSEENTARMQGYQGELNEMLPWVRRRWEVIHEDWAQHFNVDSRPRVSGARAHTGRVIFSRSRDLSIVSPSCIMLAGGYDDLRTVPQY